MAGLDKPDQNAEIAARILDLFGPWRGPRLQLDHVNQGDSRPERPDFARTAKATARREQRYMGCLTPLLMIVALADT
ncbi:hypothetical protein [Rhizobium bangladeshense]|uniref:hypothetical protein n=1 Tax=Rhizobium bangladeshense TaxID=1138189 RepID=UPI001C82F9CB|nr:hypothetical protein [Rhizobium bangladeshense]